MGLFHSRIAGGALALVFCLSAWAAEFSGRVLSVHDGDTLTVELGAERERVRLVDIDAPELKQAFGIEARGTLRALCPVNSIATVIWKQRDRNGRPLGRVMCSGMNVNAELVRKGAAWVFVRYAARNSKLYTLEAEARAAGIGLWLRPDPVPPWQWRRDRRVERTI